MSKPALTQEQRQYFEKQFNEIIKKSTKQVQDLWIDNGIIWIMDIPHFHNNIHLKLTGRLKDEHMKLDRKLKDRTI